MWDLPSTPDVVRSFGTLLTGFAAMWAAYIAQVGLSSWRNQAEWKRDQELCLELLVLLYQRHDAVKGIRNPFMSYRPVLVDDEGQQITDENDQSFRGVLKEYQKRVRVLDDVRTEFYAKTLLGDAIWDGAVTPLVSDLLQLEQRLNSAVRRYLQALDPNGPPNSLAQSEAQEEYGEVLYDVGEGDQFRENYGTAISSLESFLKAKLK